MHVLTYALRSGTLSLDKEYTVGLQKNKKKQHLESNTDWYKIVSVMQSSGYWSIYIDWQRSYYE